MVRILRATKKHSKSSGGIPRKQKKESAHPLVDMLLPPTLRLLAIDPGTRYLGWAQSTIDFHDTQSTSGNSSYLTSYGTIEGSGSGVVLNSSIVSQVMELALLSDELIIEEYVFIPGKTRGIFVVPSLIALIEYEWYRRTGKRIYRVPASMWKKVICGAGNADKQAVREAMRLHLPSELLDRIEKEYADAERKGSQDCIDAIALGLYCTDYLLSRPAEAQMLEEGE